MFLTVLSWWILLNWTVWAHSFLVASDEQVLEMKRFVSEWREKGTLSFAFMWAAMGFLGVFVFIAAALDLWWQRRKEKRTP